MPGVAVTLRDADHFTGQRVEQSCRRQQHVGREHAVVLGRYERHLRVEQFLACGERFGLRAQTTARFRQHRVERLLRGPDLHGRGIDLRARRNQRPGGKVLPVESPREIRRSVLREGHRRPDPPLPPQGASDSDRNGGDPGPFAGRP